MPPIRLIARPTSTPNATLVRLAVSERDDHAETLDAVVANFTSPVPITDSEHSRNVAAEGCPARGWCTSLKVQEGTELLGRVHWLDEAPAVSCAAGSLWARVNIERRAVHPVSGRQLGAMLRSIELVPAPTLSNQPRAGLARKDSTMTPETRTILSRLPQFKGKHPTTMLDIHACALEVIPGARDLTYDECWAKLVKPAQVALGSQEFREKVNAGRRVRVTGTAPAPAPKKATRPTLDVRGYPGANRTLKLMAYVRSRPGCGHYSHDAAHQKACELGRSHEVVS